MQPATNSSVVPFRAVGNVQPITEFNSTYQLCTFLQAEIRATKFKYSYLAKQAIVSSTTVSKIACGETKSPRSDTVIKLLNALGYKLTFKLA